MPKSEKETNNPYLIYSIIDIHPPVVKGFDEREEIALMERNYGEFNRAECENEGGFFIIHPLKK